MVHEEGKSEGKGTEGGVKVITAGTNFEEGLLDPVVLDHAVAAQVGDQFRIGRAGATPRHAGVCDCPRSAPE